MTVVLALLAAAAYGSSDFAAGMASRRFGAGAVTGIVQICGLLTAVVAVLLFGGVGPRAGALEWGALSGVGSGVGTLALYRGFSAARMSVVATLSAVLTAVIPVIVGVALGNHLTTANTAGIVIAIPAIALVSWQPRTDDRRAARAARAGLIYGILAGLSFALLFIALDRAGTHAGAWPLLPGQAVGLVLTAPFAYHGLIAAHRPPLGGAALTLGAGILSGVANLVFLAATGHGQLAIVAVLTALYPVLTVLLARVVLAERWTRLQAVGLVTAAAAIVLVTAG
jgi:drug/metabolite transporter (DMT)-like permease